MKKHLSTLFLLTLSQIAFATPIESLNITTWNIEWLSHNSVPKITQSDRGADDFERLRAYFIDTDSDILAFQEVDSVDAIQEVVGKGYTIYLSDRAKPQNQHRQFDDINQFTGFAVRDSLNVSNKSDVILDGSNNSRLRFASYIVVRPQDKDPIHILSVHLKARCQSAYKNNRHCRTLKEQGQTLNRWIVERENNEQSYIVLGDFNHTLSHPKSWLWKIIGQDNQSQLATQSTQPDCIVRSNRNKGQTYQYRSIIDHIVVSENLEASGNQQILFSEQDVLNYQLSDHCPILSTVKQR
ncbi:endonuclease/exonuclease/phosphatase family protein [Vibrio mexicanus]|uniref:endonuclease/exonuclease/phosphatase family protein n=1 Tax=Vibrio mexicanus TaxID=1004326 RepID=UPI00063CA898|nr:endonuclease/exonuclease/phosphatase family protein [Vibrio mexicanus]